MKRSLVWLRETTDVVKGAELDYQKCNTNWFPFCKHSPFRNLSIVFDFCRWFIGPVRAAPLIYAVKKKEKKYDLSQISAFSHSLRLPKLCIIFLSLFCPLGFSVLCFFFPTHNGYVSHDKVTQRLAARSHAQRQPPPFQFSYPASSRSC